jgi:hypothetical protein
MFTNCEIEHREYLNDEDFARAERMVQIEGYAFSRALHYLRGWAQDYAHESRCDAAAARDFHARAYGN